MLSDAYLPMAVAKFSIAIHLPFVQLDIIKYSDRPWFIERYCSHRY